MKDNRIVKEEYWCDFKDKEVLSMSILITNESPELCITIEE